MIKLLFFGKKVLEVGSQRCVVKRQQIPSIISRNITKRPKIMDKPRTPQKSHTYPDEKKVTPFGWFLLIAPISTFSLGVWQIKRKTWKENLMAQLESKLNMAPVALPLDLQDLENMEYQTVTIKGQFLHDKELFMGPRGMIKQGNSDGGGGLMSQRDATNGYWIITPFKLDGRQETVLINRGWVPRNALKPENRPQGQVKGTVSLSAVVRLPEPRPQFTPEHKGEIFLYRDVPRMCDVTGADPYFLDAKVESTISGGPIGGQTRVTLRNEHLSYIVTWFSLSGFTAFLWFKQVLQRKPF